MFRKVSMAALALLVVSSLAFAGEVMVAKGQVTAVAGNSLTVAGEEGQAWIFEVTEDTKVIAEGASHKTAKLEAAGDTNALSEFIRVDQHVTVKYFEEDGTRYVTKLRVH